MEFLSTILNWIESAYERIVPFYVVREYEGAVILRLGKKKSEPKPGFHWKWPLIDELLTCSICTETITVDSQSLTTKDDHNVVVSAIVKCTVTDPTKYLLKVRDVTDAISDISQGRIKNYIMSKTWEECRAEGLDNEITKKVRGEAKDWGIYIDFLTLTSLAKIRSYRIIK